MGLKEVGDNSAATESKKVLKKDCRESVKAVAPKNLILVVECCGCLGALQQEHQQFQQGLEGEGERNKQDQTGTGEGPERDRRRMEGTIFTADDP